jgi:hypothetical protein
MSVLSNTLERNHALGIPFLIPACSDPHRYMRSAASSILEANIEMGKAQSYNEMAATQVNLLKKLKSHDPAFCNLPKDSRRLDSGLTLTVRQVEGPDFSVTVNISRGFPSYLLFAPPAPTRLSLLFVNSSHSFLILDISNERTHIRSLARSFPRSFLICFPSNQESATNAYAML